MALGLLKKHREVNRVVLLPLGEIKRNPHQPRKHFDQDSIQELSRSIAANGLLQPITVRKSEDGLYELVAGERRTQAFRSLGREYIPALIEEYSGEQSAVLAMIENLQRKDLNCFEEAMGISKLMEYLNLNQHQISVKLGKAQSTVANKLRLLRYPPDLQKAILDAGLTERHARAMLRLTEMDKLEEAVNYVGSHHLNVVQTEQYIERILQAKDPVRKTKIFVVKDMRIFHNSIIKAVTMMNEAGISVSSKRNESKDYVEYYIRVPKNAIYMTAEEKLRRNKQVTAKLEIV